MDTVGELLARHDATRAELIPGDGRIWDAHTHLGVDEDGTTLDAADLVGQMRRHGVSRAFVFPLNDPDRAPRYQVPNDRVLEWATESYGMLVPFCRLDMSDEPLQEATRCLDNGARGIKLHPRAQRFGFDEAGLDPVFALAAERSVPILVHAGRGLPPIATPLRHLVERHPGAQLILAHGAIADLQEISRILTAHPNVSYDTSVWSPVDVRSLFASVSPEQVLFATDVPYGTYAVSQLQVGLLLRRIGASDDVVSDIFWSNAERVAAGRPAPAMSPPLIDGSMALSLQRMRVHEYLVMAATTRWLRQPDTPGAMMLAARACDPESDPALTDVAELLAAAQAVWDDPDRARDVFRLLQIAMCLLLDE
jgi:predicted TIM-barrel fold metal-dependent hydrolase